MPPRERRRDRDRRARRLWRHYQPPAPGEVEPEGSRPKGWTTYRRKQLKLPSVPTTPSDQTVAQVGQAWTPPDQVAARASRRTKLPPSSWGLRAAVAVLIALPVAVAVGGVLGFWKADPSDYPSPTPPPGQQAPYEPPAASQMDPRSVEGHRVLVQLLLDEQGDARITWVLMHPDNAVVGAVLADGSPVTYYWDPSEPGLEVEEKKVRDGQPFDLARIAPSLYTPLLGQLQRRLDVDPDSVDVTIQHEAGSASWFRITGASATETGVLLADRKGSLVSETIEPLP